MELCNPTTIICDVLIIGSGGAALRAAIEAKKRDLEVIVVSKSRTGYGNNTVMAGGLLAAATGWREPKDSPEMHFQDTIRGGRFMNHQKMVEIMVHNAAEEVGYLQEHGMKLRMRNGEYSVILLPGHTYPRSLPTANGIGTDFTLPLINWAQQEGSKFIDKVLITELLTKENSIVGAVGLGEGGEIYVFNAKATILATGGLVQIFARTDNAVGTTGDGMLLAYEAGASLADMEFVQYYPTTLGENGGKGVLYEILIAREGGKLRNSRGEDILEKYKITDPFEMTRDIVSRAIAQEICAGRDIDGFITLDLSSIPDEKLDKLAPLLPSGISREKRTILVAPNAHFTCGGVKTDEKAKTDVDGLFAAGEVCAGIHGANRVASNAITEVFTFGAISGKEASEHAAGTRSLVPKPADISRSVDNLKEIASREGKEKLGEIRLSLKQIMWEKAGLIRSEQSLHQALLEIDSLKKQTHYISVSSPKEVSSALRLERMITVSQMVVTAAPKRTESRGVHYRIDYPESNDRDWLVNILISKQGDDMTVTTQPVSLSGLSPD